MGKDATSKLYTHAEVEAIVAAATAPLLAKIEELELRIAKMQRNSSTSSKPPVFDADLGRAQEVAGGVERHAHAADRRRRAVGQAFDRCVFLDPWAQDLHAHVAAEVALTTGGGVVAVGVGDHGAADGLPGVDVEIARGAVEAALRRFDQAFLGLDQSATPAW